MAGQRARNIAAAVGAVGVFAGLAAMDWRIALVVVGGLILSAAVYGTVRK